MRYSLAAALALSLCACVSLPESVQQQRNMARWEAHHAALAEFTHWRASARVAIKTADDGGTVQMVWRQQANDFDVRFSAAFGHGATRIAQHLGNATLVDAKGQTSYGPSAELLLQERLGWQVPIAQLRAWLVGRPGDTADFTVRADGLLASARLRGWTVEFERYNIESYPTLPQRLVLYRDDIRVRVAIDSWSHLSQTIESQRVPLPETAREVVPGKEPMSTSE